MERTLQKGIVMLFGSQRERLLHEFPWMWAIRNEWNSAWEIQVQKIETVDLRFMGLERRTPYWAVYKNLDSAMIQSLPRSGRLVLIEALENCPNGYRLQHLVCGPSYSDGRLYAILRAPRGCDLHTVFTEYQILLGAEQVA